MKLIFLVLDGLADSPIPQLGKRTPLEEGATPHFDKVAREGVCGTVYPFFFPGKMPTSEDSHLALFGYDPKKENPGRGVLEALGLGMEVRKGDVCFRANFATVDRTGRVKDRRAGRVDGTQPLVKALSGIRVPGVKIIVKKSVGHRLVVQMRGRGLSPRVSSNDHKRTGIIPPPVKPLKKSKEASRTAEAVNEFLRQAHKVCASHEFNKGRKLPANFILVRGAGTMERVPSFRSRHGLKAACVAGGGLYKGIARFLGMEVLSVKGANALPDTDLAAKFRASVRSLSSFDFVFCHVKAADNLAEDGKWREKKKFLERVDSFLPVLLKGGSYIAVTGDHATCSLKKAHCRNAIPLAVAGPGLVPDKVVRFSEHSCKKGGFGTMRQTRALSKVLSRCR